MRTLTNLSDYDFELLVADLLRAETNIAYEQFARGADMGIDLRAEHEGLEVVQCKHFAGSSFGDLKRAARQEREKLSKLNPQPDRYRFVTSRPLTIKQKNTLKELLSPYVVKAAHIWGASDIEGMLTAHATVERQHVKLWLSGGNMLQSMLHSGSLTRSRALVDAIESSLPTYVQTKRFFDARDLLIDSGVCLIAGAPGIGKTTLARMLLGDQVKQGYDALEVSEDIEEAWNLLAMDQRQVFYYADFLGRTSIADKMKKNEDQRLVQLIQRATRYSQKTRLVLTTREYILREATQLYETFRRAHLDARRFLLKVEDYTRIEKALILYNHVYHSDGFDPRDRGDLLREQKYLEIIDHENYSPRIIEFVTSARHSIRASTGGTRNFVRFATESLNHPEEIWAHAFENELTFEQQTLLLVVASFSIDVEIEELRLAFQSVCSVSDHTLGHRAFERAIKTLEGTFLSVGPSLVGRGKLYVSFSNPSIEDFIARILAHNPDELARVVRGAVVFSQLLQMWDLLDPTSGNRRVRAARSASIARCQVPLAEAVVRCFDTWESRPSSHWWSGPSRERGLVFAIDVRQRGPDARAVIAPWLVTRLGELPTQWQSNSCNSTDGVELVRRLAQAGQRGASRRLAIALKDHLLATTRDEYDYQAAAALIRSFPACFDSDEVSSLVTEFEEYAGGRLDEEALTESDLDTLEDLARDFNATISQQDLDDARKTVREAERAALEEDAKTDEALEEREVEEDSESEAAICRLFDRLVTD